MKAINLLPTGLMAIPVEQNATNFKKTKSLTYYLQYEMNGFKYVEPIERDFKILGCITKDHIDFDVEDMVESIEVAEYKYGGELHPKDLFLDYESKTYWLESYEDSFRSLLSSNGLTDYEKLLIIKPLK